MAGPVMARNDETICTKEFASIVIDLTNKQDRDNLLETAQLKLFNHNCTITLYEERPQLFQCSKCRMYLHWTSSCRQPRCTLCSSKSHDTEDHPPDDKLKCINCKGEHPSNHKACNTRRIRLGLKPIPTTQEKTQQNKPKIKGKGQENPLGKVATTEQIDVGLTGEEISNIMKVGDSHQARKEHTTKFIQSHTMNKMNRTPATDKSQTGTEPTDMEIIVEPTPQHLL